MTRPDDTPPGELPDGDGPDGDSVPDDSLIASAYADLARATDPVEEPVAAVRRRMGRRARHRKGVAAVVCTCVVAVAAIGTIQTVNGPSPAPHANAGGSQAAPTTGPLPGGANQSCAFGYSSRTLRQRDWAADATVTEIGRGRGSVRVQLDVHTWYRGGSGDSLTVLLPSPRSEVEDAPPAFQVGTRLLLSGARVGEGWLPWSCGFTRYHDQRTAAQWAKVFAR